MKRWKTDNWNYVARHLHSLYDGIRAVEMVSDFTREDINTSCVGTGRKRKPSKVLMYCGTVVAVTGAM